MYWNTHNDSFLYIFFPLYSKNGGKYCPSSRCHRAYRLTYTTIQCVHMALIRGFPLVVRTYVARLGVSEIFSGHDYKNIRSLAFLACSGRRLLSSDLNFNPYLRGNKSRPRDPHLSWQSNLLSLRQPNTNGKVQAKHWCLEPGRDWDRKKTSLFHFRWSRSLTPNITNDARPLSS